MIIYVFLDKGNWGNTEIFVCISVYHMFVWFCLGISRDIHITNWCSLEKKQEAPHSVGTEHTFSWPAGSPLDWSGLFRLQLLGAWHYSKLLTLVLGSAILSLTLLWGVTNHQNMCGLCWFTIAVLTHNTHYTKNRRSEEDLAYNMRYII